MLQGCVGTFLDCLCHIGDEMLPTSVEIIGLPFLKDLYEAISTRKCQPRVLLTLDAIEQ